MKSLFHIEQSLNKARWVAAEADNDIVARLARDQDVPEIVARLLAGRGVPPEEAQRFLSPTFKNDFPDPFSLKGMVEMAAELAQAIRDKKSIAIFGDFDVDGATSSALLHRFFKHFGVDAPIYIPDRMAEGYGPNIEALRSLKEQGADIIMMLDCGTTAFDTVAQGMDLGLRIVILDHHEAEDTLPRAAHIINPKRKDDTSGLDMLAAVGVTFMACVAINNKLRESGYYNNTGFSEPPLKEWLDIVALGTVCDMVPLTNLNRLIVKTGFGTMHKTANPGLRALLDTAKIEGAVTPYHAGFVLGPRINAGSRVHQADLGAKLLSTLDAQEANNIAWTLHDCNDKRKEIQKEMERTAFEMIEAQGLDQNAVIIVDLPDGHPGLAGLVAGRIKEKYAKPSCVITYTPNTDGVIEGRGSGRSVPGIHIAQAFIDARLAGLLEKGGGHAMAGGFTITPDNIEAFRVFMDEHICAQSQNRNSNIETRIDAILSVRGVRADFIKMIHEKFGPFGQGHEEPLFVFSNVRIHAADIVGGAHIRTLIGDWEGGARIKAMAFKAVDTPLGDALLKEGRRAFHLAGTLKVDTWQGRENVEMHIRDGAFAIADAVKKLA